MNDYMFFLRGFVENGDLSPANELFHRIRIYPYSQRSNPKPNQVLDITGKYINTDEPEGLEYWKLLSDVINDNPVDERDRFFMAILTPLGIEKGKPFSRMIARSEFWLRVRFSVKPCRRIRASIPELRARQPIQCRTKGGRKWQQIPFLRNCTTSARCKVCARTCPPAGLNTPCACETHH